MGWSTQVNARLLAVIIDKLTMLNGLAKTALWWVPGRVYTRSWTSNTTGEESGPSPFGYACGTR
jgi:hypothetical protein